MHKIQPHPNVTFTKLDDSDGVLLHLETKDYYTLNETGMLIWELLHLLRSLPEIAVALSEGYEVEQAEALDYVTNFVRELVEEQLVLECTEA